MKRRERMVKMPPADGSLCGAEVLEVEKCMMPECREYRRHDDRTGSAATLVQLREGFLESTFSKYWTYIFRYKRRRRGCGGGGEEE